MEARYRDTVAAIHRSTSPPNQPEAAHSVNQLQSTGDRKSQTSVIARVANSTLLTKRGT